jgi:peptidyl-tRNA hydrolase
MKQVILVNESLEMPRGKLAAQVAHASVASFLSSNREPQKSWLSVGMPKVVLAVNTEEELLNFYHAALKENLPTQLIKDAGKTVVKPGTVTWVGIGPAEETRINQITGNLELVK